MLGTISIASAIIDVSMEDCAAWNFLIGSRARTLEFYQFKHGVKRDVVEINDHCVLSYSEYDLGFGRKNMFLFTKAVWKKLNESTIVTATAPYDGDTNAFHLDYDQDWFKLRGCATFYSVLKFERLPRFRGFSQTKVTFTTYFDVGGVTGFSFAKQRAPSFLMHLTHMRETFDKSDEIDAAEITRFKRLIRDYSGQYNTRETKIVERGLFYFEQFKGARLNNVKLASPLASGKMMMLKDGDACAWCWSSSIVRASPEAILASLWDTMSRATAYADINEKSIDEIKSDHNQLIYMRSKLSTNSAVRDREIFQRCVWKYLGGVVYIFVAEPEENENKRPAGGTDGKAVRARYPRAMKITRLNEVETRLDYVILPDAGSSLPSIISNRNAISSMSLVTTIQERFQSLRKLRNWEEGDGRAVGEAFLIAIDMEYETEGKETSIEVRFREIFHNYSGLKEINSKYDFFQPMMVKVVENKLSLSSSVRRGLINLSLRDGRTIGAALAASLASNLTAEAAVDEWILKYPALREMDEKEIWFRPMMDVVAMRLLGQVWGGLKTRVLMGAGLSILDMITDLSVVTMYMRENEKVFGWVLLTFIFICVSLQLGIVCINNWKNPKRLMHEIIIVLLCAKPGEECDGDSRKSGDFTAII